MLARTSTGDHPKALAIGEDLEDRLILRGLLQPSEIELIEASDGSAGLKAFYSEHPDLVVLDLELPDVDGLEVLTTIRELSDVPVVAITGHDSEASRVRGLRAGADDCITKPAGPELLARIEVLLRRPRQMEIAAVVEDDYLLIDRTRHKVEVMGVEVDLTPTEFRMLATFAENPGRVLGHGQLLDLVWGDRIRGLEEVKLYVSYLRRKLAASAALDPVETVRGIGYRYRPRVISAGQD